MRSVIAQATVVELAACPAVAPRALVVVVVATVITAVTIALGACSARDDGGSSGSTKNGKTDIAATAVTTASAFMPAADEAVLVDRAKPQASAAAVRVLEILVIGYLGC
jgi:hypothetical protein